MYVFFDMNLLCSFNEFKICKDSIPHGGVIHSTLILFFPKKKLTAIQFNTPDVDIYIKMST